MRQRKRWMKAGYLLLEDTQRDARDDCPAVIFLAFFSRENHDISSIVDKDNPRVEDGIWIAMAIDLLKHMLVPSRRHHILFRTFMRKFLHRKFVQIRTFEKSVKLHHISEHF
jgi:hypothetical protein